MLLEGLRIVPFIWAHVSSDGDETCRYPHVLHAAIGNLGTRGWSQYQLQSTLILTVRAPQSATYFGTPILVLATLVVMTLRFRSRHWEFNHPSNVLSAGRLIVFATHPLNADYRGAYGTVLQQLTRKWNMK